MQIADRGRVIHLPLFHFSSVLPWHDGEQGPAIGGPGGHPLLREVSAPGSGRAQKGISARQTLGVMASVSSKV